jgi:hypothetical protein
MLIPPEEYYLKVKLPRWSNKLDICGGWGRWFYGSVYRKNQFGEAGWATNSLKIFISKMEIYNLARLLVK